MMTSYEKRFYAFAKSILKEPDPTDMIPIFRSKHWELIGMYNNTFYVIYIKDENEYYNEEFTSLNKALNKPIELAGGISLLDYLKSIKFDITMSPENESDFKYYI